MPGQTVARETELYAPVKAFLERSGYEVRGEVAGCDLTALRGEELVVVELKRSFGLRLLIQAVNRQKAADSVYVAIPKPPRGRFSKSFWDMCHLLKRLEVGLITVSFRGGQSVVEVVLHPPDHEPPEVVRAAGARGGASRGVADRAMKRRVSSPRMRRSIIREFTGRSGDYNLGGSTGRGLVTAYRERALRISCCLEKYGPLTAAELKSLGTGDGTYGILYRNVYGWYDRVDKGTYALHEAGRCALGTYRELRARYRRELKGRRPPAKPAAKPEVEPEAEVLAKPLAGPRARSEGKRSSRPAGSPERSVDEPGAG